LLCCKYFTVSLYYLFQKITRAQHTEEYSQSFLRLGVEPVRSSQLQTAKTAAALRGAAVLAEVLTFEPTSKINPQTNEMFAG